MKSRPFAALLLLASFTAPRSWSLDGQRPRAAESGEQTLTNDSVSDARSLVNPASLSLGTVQWDQKRAFALDARGQRHRLTLDHDLQTAVLAQLRRAKARRAAAVLLSASDGRVLAAAETPLATHSDSMLWSAVTPSASLFKLITTTALIERGKLQPEHRVCSEGGEHRLELQHLTAPTAGRVVCSTFSEILAWSRNASYARLVHSHLTAEDLGNYADRFGFNAPLWADVSAELGRFHVGNEPLTVARTATGFVGSSLSVIGAGYIGYVIAKGGIASSIRFIDDEQETTLDPISVPVSPVASTDVHDLAPSRVMASVTAMRLRDMMERVVSYGTAADAFRDANGRALLPHVRVAGKTGTLGRSEGTASWFIGFAPSRDPKLVVAVLLDNGALWHVTAKRVAAAIFQQYFEPPPGLRVAAD